RLREAYRERRDFMLASLEKNLRGKATWTQPEGGMFLMVKLLGEVNATHLLRCALERRVAFVPGEEFYLESEGKNTLRLNFTNAKPREIQEGVARLAAAVRDL